LTVDAAATDQAGPKTWQERQQTETPGGQNQPTPGLTNLARIRSADRTTPTGSNWLVKNLVRRAGVGVEWGPPGAGKSTLAVDLACCVATGRRWRGRKVHQGPVVIVAAEDLEGTLAMLAAWEQHHGAEGAPLRAPVDVVHGAPTLPDDLDALAAEVEAAAAEHDQPVALVVIDTIAAIWTGGEDNEGLADFLRCCRDLAAQTSAAVLAIHHPGKDPDRGERGGSVLRAGVDFSLQVDHPGETGAITAVKVRGAPSGAQLGYRLVPVELGTDEDGDPITACIATPAEPPTRAQRLSNNQKIALGALSRLLQAADANGGGAVPETAWQEAAMRRLPDQAKPLRAYHNARDALVAKGYVHHLDGLVNIAPDLALPPGFLRSVHDLAYQLNTAPEDNRTNRDS
jgi:AAA domain